MVTRWVRALARRLRVDDGLLEQRLAAQDRLDQPPLHRYSYDPHPAGDDARWAELQARLDADGWVPVLDPRTGDRIGYLQQNTSRRDDDLPDLYVTLAPEAPTPDDPDQEQTR